MLEHLNFIMKDHVASYKWSNRHECRETLVCKHIDGRDYWSEGTLRITSFVGQVYRVPLHDGSGYRYVLTVGLSKQHPCDVTVDMREAYAVAAERSYVSPSSVIEFPVYVTHDMFVEYASFYLNAVNDDTVIKTHEEIASSGFGSDPEYDMYLECMEDLAQVSQCVYGDGPTMFADESHHARFIKWYNNSIHNDLNVELPYECECC